MNMMSLLQCISPHRAFPGKKGVFSFFSRVSGAILGSFSCRTFINSDMRSKWASGGVDFMNILQSYVEGVFNGNFWKPPFFNERAEKAYFIKLHKFGGYPGRTE